MEGDDGETRQGKRAKISSFYKVGETQGRLKIEKSQVRRSLRLGVETQDQGSLVLSLSYPVEGVRRTGPSRRPDTGDSGQCDYFPVLRVP